MTRTNNDGNEAPATAAAAAFAVEQAPAAAAASSSTKASGSNSRVPFSERPYGSSFYCTLPNDDAAESSMEDVKRILVNQKEHSQTMPGYCFNLILEDITHKFLPNRRRPAISVSPIAADVPQETSIAGSKKRKLEHVHSSSEAEAGGGRDSRSLKVTNEHESLNVKDEHDIANDDQTVKRSISTEVIGNKPKRYFCFGLWKNKHAEATNLFHQKTADTTEALLPHLTSFPKYEFWVQVQGKELSDKYTAFKDRIAKDESTEANQNVSQGANDESTVKNRNVSQGDGNGCTMKNQDVTHGDDKDQPSSYLASSQKWGPSDIVTVMYWYVPNGRDMNSCFSMLRRVRHYALKKFETSCKQYDIYLTYNQDKPNVFMELCVWTSFDAYKNQFLKNPTIRCAHAAIKTRFCQSNKLCQDITIWRIVA